MKPLAHCLACGRQSICKTQLFQRYFLGNWCAELELQPFSDSGLCCVSSTIGQVLLKFPVRVSFLGTLLT